ncbi:transcription factor HHO6 [Cajanus cajan]|uniref:Two-component response regulator ARR2 n=1 Tax=Cajanus cajan TaxID=3821 RepID=A0A151S4P4_CAJCA|nr:transcription factor HHO6 [Cajanus cajan]KYP49728.1 Two-component response regulator ARR2 [Cajanus cajan]
MGSVPAELSLDLRPTFVPKTITDFLCHLSTTPNASHKKSLLDDFVHRLELELAKIQAFKRELPLCIFLLNDAISALKGESAKCREQRTEPVLEEFIPLKKRCDQMEEIEKEKECRDKRNWMSSFQLWNSNDNNNNNNNKNAYDCDKRQHYILENKNDGEERQPVAKDLFQYCGNGNGNGNGGSGFVMPFSTYIATKEDKEDCVVNGLSLQTPGTAVNNTMEGSDSRSISCRVVSSTPSPPPPPPPQLQSARKQRRCWSPELHNCFVKALQELGGSEVATPKQIREMMRVDGLTNDEVKSHLQKFRLHIRRGPLATGATSVGGLWRQSDFFKGTSSDSPQGPLQLATQSGEGTSRTEGDNLIDDDVKSEL